MLYYAIHGMLEIKEKEVAGAGEVTLQDWVGPSDAIEGYVPHRDRTTEGEHSTICISLIAAFDFVIARMRIAWCYYLHLRGSFSPSC
jgi:hypothetical protein